MNQPLLSIIIPVYNVEKYIDKCLRSILSQFGNSNQVEIIIINDGTCDGSMHIVGHYSQQYKNISIFHQKNQGLSTARNKGLEYSSGIYVWFFDSDDWIEPDFYNHLDNLRTIEDVDVYVFKMRHFNEKGNEISGWSNWNDNIPVFLNGYDLILRGYPYTPMQQYIIRRKFLISNQLWFKSGIYHEDDEFAPRMLLKTSSVAVMPHVSYCYLRRNGGSIMSDETKLNKRKRDTLAILDEYIIFRKLEKDYRKKKALTRCLYSLVASFYNDLSSVQWEQWRSLELIQIFRKYVLLNLFKEKSFTSLLRKILFLVSPKLLKYTGYHL